MNLKSEDIKQCQINAGIQKTVLMMTKLTVYGALMQTQG